MSRVTPTQTNFNGGELSKRLHVRFDLNLYDISLAEMTGFVALPEGGLDTCPGTIRVAAAAGPCRLVPFVYSATQSYIVEMSAGSARFYTNNARIELLGEPIALTLPYDLAAIETLTYEASYDVLYLFHGAHRPRRLIREGADDFALDTLVLENGPFEPRNKDRTIIVSASGVSGDVTLTASDAIFAAGDVGGLFQVEADDFGDISSWEPGITVTNGQLLTWSERVYRVAGGSTRTGTVAPVHGEGIEWDGIGQGTDLNDNAAGGVQLEYIHDRFGILRITGFASVTSVTATVLRPLPFTTSTSYDYGGGYYDPDWDIYTPPGGAASYAFGTWRWRFGAFSDRRGWPTCGVVWNERLVLAKGPTLYGSVTGDLANHATYNELGDITNDMAFVVTVPNPNPTHALIADDKLLVLNASGLFALGPDNQAQGVGPLNRRIDRQNNEGAAAVMPVQIDGRAIYVGKARRRVIEASYAVQRNRQETIDLSRYARHIGQPRFLALASQKDPNRTVWALRGDGTLAVASYVPEEQVLGWGTRPLAPGALARSIATIPDVAGELDEVWIAAEWRGGWHVLRMDQFRQEADAFDPVMTDLSVQYEGMPASNFGPEAWLAGATIDVEADGRVERGVIVDGDGRFRLRAPAARVNAGLAFPARIVTLPGDDGGDNGPAMGKMRRISRLTLNLLDARGLCVTMAGVAPRDIEQLTTDSLADTGFAAVSGLIMLEDSGDLDRTGQITIERVAPVAATIRAIQPTVEVQPR